MTTLLSAGKYRAMRRLADPAGRFKMMAVDQRPPIIKAVTALLGPEAASFERVGGIKRSLVKALADRSSAVLIDPDYGYPAAYDVLPPRPGLLLTLESFAFAETPGGRKTVIMPGWSVEKVKRAGADGAKLLLWYRPDAAPEVLAHQHALVREVGRACVAYDLAFLLELLVYPFAGAADHSTDYIEHRNKRPELVLESVRDFAGSDYGVDIYKLESPLAAGNLPDPVGDLAGAAEAQGWFNRMAALIDKPWVMLSAGAGMEEFRRVLHYAFAAGANGFLAGRAIWWETFQSCYPDIPAMEERLGSLGRAYFDDINRMTDAAAHPWAEAASFGGDVGLSDGSPTFPSDYRPFG